MPLRMEARPMAKTKVRLESNFPAAKRAAFDAVRHARDKALVDGEATANQKIERADARLDYNLPADVNKENIGFQSGKISYDHFYGRWFEYGTVFIKASPFMRPAHRKMRKTFLSFMGDDFEGWIKRRAEVRKR
jgi:hypothetical protein